MADDVTQGQAGEEAPSTEGQPQFDPASTEVDVSGRKMTVANLQKSYAEAEKRMRELEQNSHQLKTKSESYGWADDLMQAYHNNPAIREGLDELLQGQGQTQVNRQMTPEYQKIAQIEQRQALLEMERQFDKLRERGLEVTKDMESRVLHEIATNPLIQDAEAAYKHLYWDQALAKAREQATAQTADQMSDNQTSYKGLPKGGASKPSTPDVTKMTPAQRDAYLMKRIEDDLF